MATTPDDAIRAIRETAKRARREPSDLVNDEAAERELRRAALAAATDRLATTAGERPRHQALVVRYLGRITRVNDAQRAFNHHVAKAVQLLEVRTDRHRAELEDLRQALDEERAERQRLAAEVAALTAAERPAGDGA